MKRISRFVLATALMLSACGTEAGMEVHEAWMQPVAQGKNGAVRFVMHNHSSKPDELVGASTDVADAVEIEESTMNANVMETHQVASVPVEAFADMEFGPDSPHLLLTNLKKDLHAGDEIQIILHFKNFEDIKARVLIQATPPSGEEH